MLPVQEIESYVIEKTKNIMLVTHDFGHLKRVAAGAAWFVRAFNGNKEDEDMAYVAGLLHDIVRPASDKMCHAKASAEESGQILRGFKLKKPAIGEIALAIRDHRLPPEDGWASPLHQSVYLADKIFEQMGAYIAFRRCMYVGECRDYEKDDPLEAISRHFKMRVKRVPKTNFPERFHRLVDYQWEWLVEMDSALDKEEPWAANIARQMYHNGRTHGFGLEEAIRNMKTISSYEKDEKYRREALDYIEGRKWDEFERLV